MTAQRIRLYASDIQRSGLKVLAGDYEPATEYMRVVGELEEIKRTRDYPHMCRREHAEIGHSDSEHELCPLCRMTNRAEDAEARVAELVEIVRDLENKLRRSLDECREVTA